MVADSDLEIECEVTRIMAQSYHREAIQNENGGWDSQVGELPWCVAVGKTLLESLDNLDSTMEAWIRGCIQSHLPVLPPNDRFVWRNQLLR